jgi:hypothetical protein
MKILFSSYLFDPSVGGIESVSKILAGKFRVDPTAKEKLTKRQQMLRTVRREYLA